MNNNFLKVVGSISAAVIVWGSTAYHYINTGFSIAMIVFSLFALWYFLKYRPKEMIRFDRYIIMALGIFFLALLISTLFHIGEGTVFYRGLSSVLKQILIPLPLLMIVCVGWDIDIRKPVGVVFFALCFAMCGYGLYEYFVKHLPRLNSFYTTPVHVATMLEVWIPFTLAFAWYYRKVPLCRNSLLLLLPLEGLTFFLTETRGSIVSLALSVLAVLAIFLWRQRQGLSCVKKWIILAVSILFIMGAAGFSLHIGQESAYRMQGEDRPYIWKSGYHMWEDHKLAGVGLGGWQEAYDGKYKLKESREGKEETPHAHNMWLMALSTGGIIAFIGYNLYLIFMGIYFWKSIHKHPADPFRWSLLVVFFSFFLHGMLDQTFSSKPFGHMYYLAFGITLLFERWRGKELVE